MLLSHCFQTHILLLLKINMNSDQNQERTTPTTPEPVRSRWTPKPEQIQILETIFNGGTVNPDKKETVNIRKILEKYGSVGDANVFYWFQNRRSRSRRRQRQLQAAAAVAAAVGDCSGPSNSSLGNHSTGAAGMFTSFGDDLHAISQQMDGGSSVPSTMGSFDASQLRDQSGTISVFINGIPSEVPSGPFDMRAMFAPNVVLVNSSGELLPFNECGILLQSLQMGENYFLVSRPT